MKNIIIFFYLELLSYMYWDRKRFWPWQRFCWVKWRFWRLNMTIVSDCRIKIPKCFIRWSPVNLKISLCLVFNTDYRVVSAYRFCLLLRMTRWVSWRRYSSACVPSGRLGGDNPQSRRSRSNAGRPEWRRPPGNRTWQTGPGYPEKSTQQLSFENCLKSLEQFSSS